MRKIGIIAVLSLMMMALAAVPALAANPHFLRGPTFTDNGTTVTTTGTIAGLGNQDVTVQVLASGTGTVTCTNPAGKVAPGQDQEINTSEATYSTDEAIPQGHLQRHDVAPGATDGRYGRWLPER